MARDWAAEKAEEIAFFHRVSSAAERLIAQALREAREQALEDIVQELCVLAEEMPFATALFVHGLADNIRALKSTPPAGDQPPRSGRDQGLEEAARLARQYGAVNPAFNPLAEQIRALKGRGPEG